MNGTLQAGQQWAGPALLSFPRPSRSGGGILGSERGAGSVGLLMLLLLAVVIVSCGTLVQTLTLVHGSAAREQAAAQALCLAESGIQVAEHYLASGKAYAGESGTSLGTGRFSVSVRRASPVEITATGEAPYVGRMRVRRSIRVRGTASGGHFRVQSWEEPAPGQ